ncbi:DUF5324 family protein [Streptacidiphilus monticola]|uniref:DUF5324 family protein n=1 Tax=Streptacidiphilus monticola TaxID=2161674 RepID=A0ABW1FYE4_9ACTN
MTRIDAAREAAAHYTDEAWQKVAPRVGSAVEHARLAAQSTVDGRVVPLWEQAKATVPTAAQDAVSRATERGKAAAVQARLAAAEAALQARDRAVPVLSQAAQEVHDRGAAALPVLRGQISLSEIEALAEAHRKATRKGRWGKRLVFLTLLGAAVGGGVAAWKWWDKQAHPDWLVEPPTTPLPIDEAAVGGSSASASVHDTVNGSLPLDPEVEAKESEDAADAKDQADKED